LNEQGTTIVLVTHSEEVAQRAARIVRVADGLIVSDDPVERPLEIELAG
jgi:predicted ABC-type transport system involved in lysophospholipase L1 biosynthesis ATPase subunit